MDLTLFFSPVPASILSLNYTHNSFYKNIRVYDKKMPDLQDVQIALLGIEEERGTDINQGAAKGPNEIRKKLYALKKGVGQYKIVDLGNLNIGIDLAETHTRISEVCRMLIERNIMPVVIGGTHDLGYGQYRAYEEMEKLISLVNVDAFLDLEEGQDKPYCKQHIHKILLHEPNYLMSYTHLAYQSYLVDMAYLAVLEKLYFETFRVGQIRTNLTEMEPAIRNADLLLFDITAIKSADALGNANAKPFGLTGEEACQLCWYAGMNDKLSSVGFYEYNPAYDDAHQKTAAVVAIMIWYLIEGFYHRKGENNFKSNDFIRYIVSMPAESETITFYKSKVTEKWWMEIIHHQVGVRYERNMMVPCSYTDYQTATKGEVPERYINALLKNS